MTASNLQLDSLHLVGGDRTVEFKSDFSIIEGVIYSGKTTLVNLIRAALGRGPDNLPHEIRKDHSIRIQVRLGSDFWIIERPLVTTDTSKVNLSRREATRSESNDQQRIDISETIVDALRLPSSAATKTEPQTYQSWILEKLRIPEVSVPRARTQIKSAPTPVTINDWLNYCIVKDAVLDTSVFGHDDPFVDRKRRAVFELNYGIFDRETATLQAALRSAELRLEKYELTIESVRGFLKDTPFSSQEELENRLKSILDSLKRFDLLSSQLADEAHEMAASLDLRRQIAQSEVELEDQEKQTATERKNLSDLRDLQKTLESQSRRLTRAIVAGEWFVDFDFIVCPRCGTDVNDAGQEQHVCYLCRQEPKNTGFQADLVKEQQLVAVQAVETQELIENRESQIAASESLRERLRVDLERLNEELVRRTEGFVSAHADKMTSIASDRARLQAEAQKLEEYRDLFVRFNDREKGRARLEEERAELAYQLRGRMVRTNRANQLIANLESRFLEYLQRLNASFLDEPLSVAINRTTFLPEISTRRFDQLSSQGLTVLVNVAHTLAHHTVSIDHGLPLPGFIVLDGLSSNVGPEGFDGDRLDDIFKLLIEETAKYRGQLQVIALTNYVPEIARDSVVLTLTREDRLIRN